MNTNSVYLHPSTSVNNNAAGQVFKEGSSVLVRILADKGNGRYEGSVGGVRVNLTANNSIEPGSVFKAIIGIKNGAIQIVPAGDNEPVFKNLNVGLLSLGNEGGLNGMEMVNNPQMAAFLKSIGLPADNLSLHLFQQMKQLGLKFNPALMKKLHSVAARFKGKEKAAGGLLLLLMEKGLDLEADNLDSLLWQLEYRDFLEDKDETEYGSIFTSNTLNEDELKFVVKNFIMTVLKSEFSGEGGILTLLNHLGWNVSHKRMENGSWCYIPFNIEQNSGVTGKGRLGIFLDSGLKMKDIHLKCLYKKRNFIFLGKFEAGNCKEIRMNIDNCDEIKKNMFITVLKKSLMSSGYNTLIKWANVDELEGTACGSEEIFLFGGSV